VQDEVEKALKRLQWQGKRIAAAGRTDAGVHASGQVIAFDLDWQHSTQSLCQALNAYLPEDIVVWGAQAVNHRFDPRRDAQARQYQYRIFFQEQRNPLRQRYAWRVWPPADLDLLQQAAENLLGTHDYRCFGTPPRAGGRTIRTVQQAHWQRVGADLVFEVVAQAFLYHMVRRMVALQVAFGQGKVALEEIVSYIDPPAGNPDLYVQGLAPPQGLCLTRVWYPPEKLAENNPGSD
jgi:tRNA pseudouridine38-40 synthase